MLRSKPRVIVTRPAEQQSGLVALLDQNGFEPIPVPMLQIERLPELPLPDLTGFDTLVFISTNAVSAWEQATTAQPVKISSAVRVFGVGHQTVKALAHIGMSATTPTVMTTEGLLNEPWFQQKRSVLIVKGEGGRITLQQTLQEQGSVVDTWSGYRRMGPSEEAQRRLAQLLTEGVDAMLVQSGEALVHVIDAAGPLLARLILVVPSERVALQTQGSTCRVVVAPSALDSDMVAALNQAMEQQEIQQ